MISNPFSLTIIQPFLTNDIQPFLTNDIQPFHTNDTKPFTLMMTNTFTLMISSPFILMILNLEKVAYSKFKYFFFIGLGNGYRYQNCADTYEHIWWRDLRRSTCIEVILLCCRWLGCWSKVSPFQMPKLNNHTVI